MIMRKHLVKLFVGLCAAVTLLAGCSRSGSSSGNGTGTDGEVQRLIEGSLEYIRENAQTVDMWEQAEYAFEAWTEHSDDVKSLSERDDYAKPMMDMYIASELPPYEAGDDASKTFREQELMEVFLSQSSACGQLSEDDRHELVKRMISNAMARENKEAYVLDYSSAFFKNIEWQGSSNEWYGAMRSMEFNDSEKKFMEQFYADCDAVQSYKAAMGVD